MGQGMSYPQCSEYDNNEIVYLIKLYSTLSKAIQILNSLNKDSSKISELISNPSAYLIDLQNSIPDIVNNDPNDLSEKILPMDTVVIGVENKEQVTKKYTSLHVYNDFILKELSGLDKSKLAERIEAIKNSMQYTINLILTIFTEYCHDIGIY